MSMYPVMEKNMRKEREKFAHLEEGWNRVDDSQAKNLYKGSMGTKEELAAIGRQKEQDYARRVDGYNRGEIPVSAIMYPEIPYHMHEKEEGEIIDRSSEWVAEHGTIDGFKEYMSGLRNGLNIK